MPDAMTREALSALEHRIAEQAGLKLHGEWMRGKTGSLGIQWPNHIPRDQWPDEFPVVCWSEAIDDEWRGSRPNFIAWIVRTKTGHDVSHTMWVRAPSDPKAEPYFEAACNLLSQLENERKAHA